VTEVIRTGGSGHLDAAVSAIVGRQVPGVSFAAVSPEGIQLSNGVGVADIARARTATTDTVYAWFSMTKLVTATAVMQLAEHGALDLDGPAADLVPAMALATWHGTRVKITIRQLLSHTAGLPNPIPVGWVHRADSAADGVAFAERLLNKHTRLTSPPGAQTAYSNLGYVALGRAIAAASSQTYEDYVRNNILQRIGMSATDFTYTEGMRSQAATGYQPRWSAMTLLLRLMLPRGILDGAFGGYVAFHPFFVNGAAYGGLLGPVTDAARFATLHLNGGVVDGTRVISEKSVAKMQRLAASGRDLDVGLGWFRKRADSRRGETFVEHLGGGAGFFNVMRLYPDRARAVVLMGNSTSYTQDRILKSVLEQSMAK
jgi:CubicO group peptidase (beta-lactamase class C family)